MRFIVYGAGAVGGVIAARLHLGGQDVQVVARGAHLEAIRRTGLRLVTSDDESVVPVPAAASLADLDVGSDTAVLVAVKSHQTAAVMHDVARWTPPDVTLVSAQNGVANEAVLRALPDARPGPGRDAAGHPPRTRRGRPGQQQQAGAARRRLLPVGHLRPRRVRRGRVASRRLRVGRPAGHHGVEAPQADDEPGQRGVRRLRAGPGARPGWWSWRQAEGEAVLAAAGIPVVSAAEDKERRGDLLDTSRMRARGGSSTWQSLRRGTGDVEVDYFNGEVSLLGRLHGVPTPANDLLRDATWRLAAARREPGSLSAADLLEELHR